MAVTRVFVKKDLDQFVAARYTIDEWQYLRKIDSDLEIQLSHIHHINPKPDLPVLTVTFTQFRKFIDRLASYRVTFADATFRHPRLPEIFPQFLVTDRILPEEIPQLLDYLEDAYPAVYPTSKLLQIDIKYVLFELTNHEWEWWESNLVCDNKFPEMNQLLIATGIDFEIKSQINLKTKYCNYQKKNQLVISNGPQLYERLWKQHRLVPTLNKLTFLPGVIVDLIGTYIHS